ncbi:MAG: transporter substrate-binding domain-containing protein, partial [Roseovarius sp.]
DKVMRTGKLMVGCVPNPPFASVDPSSSEWKGLHVKMASDLAEQMGVEWECVNTTWGNAALAIQTGKVDVVMTLSATPARAKAITFAGPVYQQSYMMVYGQNVEPKQTWTEYDNPDLRVAIVTGTSNEQLADSLMPNATKVKLAPNSSPSLAVTSGRADAYLSSLFTGMIALGKNPNIGGLSIPEPAATTLAYAGMRNEPDRRFTDFVGWWAEWNRNNGTIENWFRDALVNDFGVPSDMMPDDFKM